MAKEACTMFEVQAKQLLKLLSGKVYLGGTSGKQPSTESQGPKHKKKQKQSHTAVCEGNVAGEDIEPPTKK